MPRGYRPGDSVPKTGIYRVQHGSSHRLVHEATINTGIRFPRCRTCQDQVKFILLRETRAKIIIPFRSTEILEEYDEVLVGVARAK